VSGFRVAALSLTHARRAFVTQTEKKVSFQNRQRERKRTPFVWKGNAAERPAEWEPRKESGEVKAATERRKQYVIKEKREACVCVCVCVCILGLRAGTQGSDLPKVTGGSQTTQSRIELDKSHI